MPLVPVRLFLARLRTTDVLTPVQMQALRAESTRSGRDLHTLADFLLQHGWITPFQIDQLLDRDGIPLRIGPYLLLSRLGARETGRVFSAQHRQTTQKVALKIVPFPAPREYEAIALFERTANLVRQLAHLHLAPLVDAGRGETCFYLAMEFLHGEDLGSILRQQGRMPVAKACTSIQQTARGLAYLHAHGVSHGAIHPRNLLCLSSDSAHPHGVIKILDLGLTTMHGEIATDLHGLGCTFHELLTGSPAPPLARSQDFGPAMAPGILHIVTRLLSHDPAVCYHSMAEVVRDLEDPREIASPQPLDWRAAPEGELSLPRRRAGDGQRWRRGAIVGGLLLLAALGLAWFGRLADSRNQPPDERLRGVRTPQEQRSGLLRYLPQDSAGIVAFSGPQIRAQPWTEKHLLHALERLPLDTPLRTLPLQTFLASRWSTIREGMIALAASDPRRDLLLIRSDIPLEQWLPTDTVAVPHPRTPEVRALVDRHKRPVVYLAHLSRYVCACSLSPEVLAEVGQRAPGAMVPPLHRGELQSLPGRLTGASAVWMMIHHDCLHRISRPENDFARRRWDRFRDSFLLVEAVLTLDEVVGLEVTFHGYDGQAAEQIQHQINALRSASWFLLRGKTATDVDDALVPFLPLFAAGREPRRWDRAVLFEAALDRQTLENQGWALQQRLKRP